MPLLNFRDLTDLQWAVLALISEPPRRKQARSRTPLLGYTCFRNSRKSVWASRSFQNSTKGRYQRYTRIHPPLNCLE